ncbi:MAG: hypothetical protein ACRDPS_10235 [Nocardioides sp.]|uniref:hypothetical protein n=1 Tax=Nocardioides sp. TaxID=35761 RepID=UPI003D6C5B19
MTDLSELFAEQQTNVIDWNGTVIYGLFEFNEVPTGVRLTFASAAESPVQGVQLRIRGGVLEANGVEGEDIVLWRDSAPSSVVVSVRRRGRGKTSLKLWNVWRGGHDVTQAWLGNSAIQVEGDPASDSFRLRCSDGQGEANFDDLVLDVELE